MREYRGRRVPWSRPLADHVQSVIDPVLTRRGFGVSSLVLFWDDIVGERLGAMSQPVRVQWPILRHGPARVSDRVPATLIVCVEPGFALELQHLAPLIIERVNAHFGWRCIARLKLKQGPVAGRPAARRQVPPIDKEAEEAAQEVIGKSVTEPLRQALTRLGARILA